MRVRVSLPRTKATILAGRPILAANPGGVSLPAVEALAACGADCLFIDCERTAISVESVPMLARAAQACGMSAVVRSPSKDPAILTRYFDCGIDGLVLPQVESVEACAMLHETARAATRGREGDLMLIVQIESAKGHANLDAIAAAPGIDLILVGPNDLAHSMGFLGDTNHPDLIAAVDDITLRLAAAGRAFGLPVTGHTTAHWVGRGATFLYATLETLLRPGVVAIRQAAVA
ncbi:HpcH/HpaI aldolase family protein [Roseixanthobacter pseudopolyaromaticivorans]|uniref:HpcH/HpaI aldolase family protein n=1 Tax=Xanthobacteraceae TaxID=335928 RepID=UPI003729124D